MEVKKINTERTETILNISLQIASHLSVFSEPFLPFTAGKLRNMLNINEGCWNRIEKLKPGHKINSANLLFAKIDDETIELQLRKLNSNLSHS